MKSYGTYRGIEYSVSELGNGRWEWMLRPAMAALVLGHSLTGQVLGPRQDAVTAAERAINLELG